MFVCRKRPLKQRRPRQRNSVSKKWNVRAGRMFVLHAWSFFFFGGGGEPCALSYPLSCPRSSTSAGAQEEREREREKEGGGGGGGEIRKSEWFVSKLNSLWTASHKQKSPIASFPDKSSETLEGVQCTILSRRFDAQRHHQLARWKQITQVKTLWGSLSREHSTRGHTEY